AGIGVVSGRTGCLTCSTSGTGRWGLVPWCSGGSWPASNGHIEVTNNATGRRRGETLAHVPSDVKLQGESRCGTNFHDAAKTPVRDLRNGYRSGREGLAEEVVVLRRVLADVGPDVRAERDDLAPRRADGGERRLRELSREPLSLVPLEHLGVQDGHDAWLGRVVLREPGEGPVDGHLETGPVAVVGHGHPGFGHGAIVSPRDGGGQPRGGCRPPPPGVSVVGARIRACQELPSRPAPTRTSPCCAPLVR